MSNRRELFGLALFVVTAFSIDFFLDCYVPYRFGFSIPAEGFIAAILAILIAGGIMKLIEKKRPTKPWNKDHFKNFRP